MRLAALNLAIKNLEVAELRAWAQPGIMRLAEAWLDEEKGPAPLEVCDVCGCAHHSWWGGTCNSCREGQRAAQQQLRSEQLRRACCGRRI